MALLHCLTHTWATAVMKTKLRSAVGYELWQCPPELLLLIDGEDGNTDSDKAMHKRDPSTHTTGVKAPPS